MGSQPALSTLQKPRPGDPVSHPKSNGLMSPPPASSRLQPLALITQDPGDHGRGRTPAVERGVRQDRAGRGDGPDDRRVDPVSDEADAELADRIGAREAGLGGGVEGRPREIPASGRVGRRPAGERFGVGGDGRADRQGLGAFADDRAVDTTTLPTGVLPRSPAIPASSRHRRM
jgi:hypothetical protein